MLHYNSTKCIRLHLFDFDCRIYELVGMNIGISDPKSKFLDRTFLSVINFYVTFCNPVLTSMPMWGELSESPFWSLFRRNDATKLAKPRQNSASAVMRTAFPGKQSVKLDWVISYFAVGNFFCWYVILQGRQSTNQKHMFRSIGLWTNLQRECFQVFS